MLTTANEIIKSETKDRTAMRARSEDVISAGMLPNLRKFAPAETKLGKNVERGNAIKNASEKRDIHLMFWTYAPTASLSTFINLYLQQHI
jgi:hypothetical protein